MICYGRFNIVWLRMIVKKSFRSFPIKSKSFVDYIKNMHFPTLLPCSFVLLSQFCRRPATQKPLLSLFLFIMISFLQTVALLKTRWERIFILVSVVKSQRPLFEWQYFKPAGSDRNGTSLILPALQIHWFYILNGRHHCINRSHWKYAKTVLPFTFWIPPQMSVTGCESNWRGT